MALPSPAGRYSFLPPSSPHNPLLHPTSIPNLQNPNNLKNPSFTRNRCPSIRPNKCLLSFLEAISELERMARDPSDILAEVTARLSARELKLMLVYFAQEGRDLYCALEVFEWLRKEKRVDGETMELMVSIACGWIERIIGEDDHGVDDVVGVLNEMDCIGLEPGFSMVEKVVSLYWDRGKKEEAVAFVRDVMRRGGVGVYGVKDGWENGRGGAVGYVAWKMMVSLWDFQFFFALFVTIVSQSCLFLEGEFTYMGSYST